MEKMSSPNQKPKYRPEPPPASVPSQKKKPSPKASEATEEEQWVQCEECSKWRRVPSHVNVAKLPEIWCVIFS